MNSKQIVYLVNGVATTGWRRLAASKTFWVVNAFVLTAADRWNRGDISGSDFFQMVQIGVIGILIRAAMARSELAANAANPDVSSVAARMTEAKIPPEITGPLACMIVAGALLTLTACTGGAALPQKLSGSQALAPASMLYFSGSSPSCFNTSSHSS